MTTNTNVTYVDDDYVFNFGKYKGKGVGWVITNDPDYFFWAIDNVEWLKINPQDEEQYKTAKFVHNALRPFKGPPSNPYIGDTEHYLEVFGNDAPF